MELQNLLTFIVIILCGLVVASAVYYLYIRRAAAHD